MSGFKSEPAADFIDCKPRRSNSRIIQRWLFIYTPVILLVSKYMRDECLEIAIRCWANKAMLQYAWLGLARCDIPLQVTQIVEKPVRWVFLRAYNLNDHWRPGWPRQDISSTMPILSEIIRSLLLACFVLFCLQCHTSGFWRDYRGPVLSFSLSLRAISGRYELRA